jgi:hypothetical protein
LNETVRLVLMIAIAGCAMTLCGSAAAWWFDEERRLRRLIRRCLGGEPDAMVVARGRAAGAGFRLASNQAVVLWHGGAKALLYPLHALQGAELIVDDRVVARVFRGEPRRALDVVETGARSVTLRLIFDNPRDPDFDLDMWLPHDGHRRDSGTPGAAIQEARSWLARSEALLRMPPPVREEPRVAIEPQRMDPPVEARPLPPVPQAVEPEPPPPWEDDLDDLGEDSEQDGEPDLFDPRRH